LLDLDHDRRADAIDLNGGGSLDVARITLLNTDAANLGRHDFQF
jgi:hypothetical protein